MYNFGYEILTILSQIIRGWNISRGWVSFHLHGRVALLSLRDEEQLKTQTSQKLHEIISMIHVSFCIVFCVTNNL